MALLVLCEKSEQYVDETHLCGDVKFILILKSKYAE